MLYEDVEVRQLPGQIRLRDMAAKMNLFTDAEPVHHALEIGALFSFAKNVQPCICASAGHAGKGRYRDIAPLVGLQAGNHDETHLPVRSPLARPEHVGRRTAGNVMDLGRIHPMIFKPAPLRLRHDDNARKVRNAANEAPPVPTVSQERKITVEIDKERNAGLARNRLQTHSHVSEMTEDHV